jgi:tRNA(fMet)-specific endonuclease VapC
MSRYVLDRDILSLFQEGNPIVHRTIALHSPKDLSITIISVEEQLSGWIAMLRRTTDRPRLARLYQRLTDNTNMLAHFNILSFSLSAIERFEELRSLKLNVGSMDLRIAVITIDTGCTLVTRNLRDFKRIPGLPLEDWSV